MSDRIHVDVCPECGTADSRHGLDPPPHCPHQYECFVPVVYMPAEVTEEMVSRLVNAFRYHGRPVGDGVARLALLAALEEPE